MTMSELFGSLQGWEQEPAALWHWRLFEPVQRVMKKV